MMGFRLFLNIDRNFLMLEVVLRLGVVDFFCGIGIWGVLLVSYVLSCYVLVGC